MNNLVSVIIPSYNHEKYIKDCVMSVLNQTYKKIEVYVMDDCSMDNSAKIIKKIKDPRLKVFCSKKNKGTVKTINELMEKCKGDYIAIIGSDDIWKKNKIEKQVKYLKNHINIGAVFTTAEVIDENGDLYVDDDAFNDEVFKKENMSSGKRMRFFFENGNHLCHSSSLIRTDVVKKIGFYNIMYRQLHDYDYWVRLINEYSIHIIDEKLVKYRRFKKSKQNLSNNSSESMIRVVNENNSIIYWMFENIHKSIFKEGFEDLFINKNSNTNEELVCEKYFILLKYKFNGANNKELALSMLYNYSNKEKLFSLLENKYNYTLNDFYEESGKTYDTFNYIYLMNGDSENGKIIKNDKRIIEEQTKIININNDKINILNNHINILKNSISWKITKPFRKLKGLIKSEKNK